MCAGLVAQCAWSAAARPALIVAAFARAVVEAQRAWLVLATWRTQRAAACGRGRAELAREPMAGSYMAARRAGAAHLRAAARRSLAFGRSVHGQLRRGTRSGQQLVRYSMAVPDERPSARSRRKSRVPWRGSVPCVYSLQGQRRVSGAGRHAYRGPLRAVARAGSLSGLVLSYRGAACAGPVAQRIQSLAARPQRWSSPRAASQGRTRTHRLLPSSQVRRSLAQ
eukprot:scaffold20734_cov106-Phaeocystis_antarctica.AAC.1